MAREINSYGARGHDSVLAEKIEGGISLFHGAP